MKSLLPLILVPLSTYALFDKAYVGAYVVDIETACPLAGAGITARFEDDIGWRAWTEEAHPDIKKGITDKNGACRLSGRTNCGKCWCWVSEPPIGYYIPHHGGEITYVGKSFLGVWQPEDTVVTIALQRVEHPIPLFLKRAKLFDRENGIGGFDGTNAVLKYDLMVGDWLPPHGNGLFADVRMIAHLELGETVAIGRTHLVTFYAFSVNIEFDGEGNGLYEKDFKGENFGIKFRVAPDSGYVSGKRIRFGLEKRIVGPNISPGYFKESRDDRCYCFRIRSRFDEKGNLVEAYYGKIYGDFKFEGSNKPGGFMGAEFDYYLNPKSLDRNLEWDMKNNLDPESKKRRPWEPPFYRMEP